MIYVNNIHFLDIMPYLRHIVVHPYKMLYCCLLTLLRVHRVVGSTEMKPFKIKALLTYFYVHDYLLIKISTQQ